ncbi:DUF4124 domain-containing protein [Ottowia caeni]|uniref:DUF4124 domain-containing protein n=1 Tax=Ottowia caeni TaxID=2870339 RepID=UPI003D70FD43
MNIVRIFLACAVLATCGAASAQYQWVDKDGRKIFSDRPPCGHTPEKCVEAAAWRQRGSTAHPAANRAGSHR